jgi:hypothetical protein
MSGRIPLLAINSRCCWCWCCRDIVDEPRVKRSSSNASTVVDQVQRGRFKRVIEHCLASALCVATLYAVLLVMSECVGCFVEILVFTLMGIIVNAGTLLKYVALVVMLIVYSYDCFNNVEKKYLKLNRALFAEVC